MTEEGTLPADGAAPHRGSGLGLLGRLAFPLLTAAYLAGFLHSIWDMDRRSAMYPRIVIALLGALTVWVVVAEILGHVREGRGDRAQGAGVESRAGPPAAVGWRRSAVAIGTFFLLLVAIPRLGFYFSATTYLLVTMFLLGQRNPVRLVITVAALVLCCYWFFTVLLGLFLPTGILF